MRADPFSEILGLANAQSVSSGGFTAGGTWGIRFPPFDKLKFSAVLRGRCWLLTDGMDSAVRLETGDALLLSGQSSFVLVSDMSAVPVDAAAVFSPNVSEIVKLNDGEDFLQIGGFVRLDPESGGFLSDVLPPMIHVRAASPQAAVLQWLLGQLVREQEEENPGASLVSSQLAQLIFVHLLRAYLDESDASTTGWLRALRDKRLAPALRLMHGNPGRAWKLEELAKAAAMSRTSFAFHFKAAAGLAPLTYLTEWRMALAKKALRNENMPVAALAETLGYTSESAFIHAFKRVTGSAPRRYRRQSARL